jgi:hypothetical protein
LREPSQVDYKREGKRREKKRMRKERGNTSTNCGVFIYYIGIGGRRGELLFTPCQRDLSRLVTIPTCRYDHLSQPWGPCRVGIWNRILRGIELQEAGIIRLNI